MHFILMLALLVVGLFSPNAVADDPSYSIVLPKFVRPGVPTKFVAEILKSDGYVIVQATLQSSDSAFISNAADAFNSGESAIMEFKAVPFDYDGSTDFTVSVEGVDQNGGVIFKDKTEKKAIEFQKKFLSIFIQTDKAIYQPSQTIKFRAVVTTPDLMPYDGEATYKLVDPNSNVIIMERDARLINGVVGSQFRLGRYSTLGVWKIVYQVHGFEETLPITVDEYKLPKFKVEVKPHKTFLHPGSRTFSGEISATFTFGQPVKGSAWLSLFINKKGFRKVFSTFNGTVSFDIDPKEIEEIGWNPKYTWQKLNVTAYVKDKNTGDELQDTVLIDLKNTKYKVEAIAKPENIKPGLPYVAYLKVSEQDGTLLSDTLERKPQLLVKISYRLSFPFGFRFPVPPIKEEEIMLSIGPDGVAVLNFVSMPENFGTVDFDIHLLTDHPPDKDKKWTSWTASSFESPSNTYLQVSTDDSTLSVNDFANLKIHTTKLSEAYSIIILARGKLIKKNIVKPTNYEREKHSHVFPYQFLVTSEMSPNVYVLVSYVRLDGEVVADSIKLNVEASLKNEVTIMTSTDKTDAGNPVEITVKTAPNSFVGLRAIDQSVLLLKEGNDITQDKVFADLDKYGTSNNKFVGWGGAFGRWWWPYPIGGADVKEVFENSGVIILTDARVYSKAPPHYAFMRELRFWAPRRATGSRSLAIYSQLNEPIREYREDSSVDPSSAPRTFFPETWIWTDNAAGSDGSAIFHYNTPDTITTWELSSFAISDAEGLGVTKQNSKITVFRNFFVSLNLPPTMIRGEILNMKTTLFNYFDTELTVTVALNENEWYNLIIVGKDKDAAGPKRKVTIPSKDSVTVVFPIKFKKSGVAKVSVKAVSNRAGDAVERTLVVKPEGIPKIESKSTIIDRENDKDPETTVTFDVDIPKDVVTGSPYVKFAVSGNILGSALNNLGSLLKMPGGCGEQTMLNFAPDVFISLYLKNVGQLTGQIKQKSKTHIQEGYQNELRYQRSDGSFSAFGKSDRSGSTWLTAFVTKCFIAAMELDSDLVEKSKIEDAIKFIVKQQNQDGTFNEPGRILHKSMQGGVNSKETTTAYMLIAMAEGNYFADNKEVIEAMENAQRYLERKMDSVRDVYTLSIMAYALALAGSKESETILNILDDKATVSGNLRYWEKKEPGMSHCVNRKDYCPFPDDKPSASSIEITAYVALTYVKMERSDQIMPIVRWLVEQRGAFGGYQSTQDTVMAIQALATVAALVSDRKGNLDITVEHDAKTDFSEKFTVNPDNAMVLQMIELPGVSGTVTATATGKGFADIQLTVSYNLPAGPRSDEPFLIDIDVKNNQKDNVVVLVTCSKINERRKEVIDGTGMFVISVDLPSGYTVDDKEATRENRDIKLVELVNDEVTGYFDELPKGRTICMTLKLRRYAEVSGVKPQLVKGFDYYQPARMAMRQYRPDKSNANVEEGVCALCRDACVGCSELLSRRAKPPIPCCTSKPFPCPVFVDGLFYDTESHISHMITKYPSHTSCTAPNGTGDSRNAGGIPGSLLDGDNQFILCTNPIFTRALTSLNGFTLSLLVHPKELSREKSYRIFSLVSEDGEDSYVVFEKMSKKKVYTGRVRANGYDYSVLDISVREIPRGRWTLITLRVDGAFKPQFYINGEARGNTSGGKRKNVPVVSKKVNFLVGSSQTVNQHGNFKGLVTNLDIWGSALSDENIKAHYNYYKDIINNKDPLLTNCNVGHVVPDSIRHCFDKAYKASELKGRVGELETLCD